MTSIQSNFAGELLKSLWLFRPEIALLVTFVLALLLDLIFRKQRFIAGATVIAGFVATGIIMMTQGTPNGTVFSNMLAVDAFSQYFKYLILLASVIVVLMSFFSDELTSGKRSMGEYYTLIAGMTFGMFLLTGASNLIMIYLAVETMSLSSYVLAGYTKEIRRASEASLKYVIYGSLSSGLMIYGMSILFGLTGSLNLFEINAFLASHSVNVFALAVSGLMILAGIGYKISAVPFHFWTPDVYEGAPVTITAFLSVASKAAGFAVLIRFFKTGLINPGISSQEVWQTINGIDWKYLIAAISVLSMTVGNFVALWQTNMKRMLAYSSIAHAGYLLMGVAVMTNAGILGVLVYFLMYLIMNLGAFYIIQLFGNKVGSEELEDLTGIGYQAPGLAVAMTIFLVSLTGLPPTAGFIGKFYLFSAVIDAGWYWLAVIGVLNTVVSLFFYFKLVRNMWLRGVESGKEKHKYTVGSQVLMYALAIPALLFGIFNSSIIQWARQSVGMFFGN